MRLWRRGVVDTADWTPLGLILGGLVLMGLDCCYRWGRTVVLCLSPVMAVLTPLSPMPVTRLMVTVLLRPVVVQFL